MLRLYTPTWESTAVILLGGLCPCVLVRALNKGRSPQNCMDTEWVSARLVDTILRDDDKINGKVNLTKKEPSISILNQTSKFPNETSTTLRFICIFVAYIYI